MATVVERGAWLIAAMVAYVLGNEGIWHLI